MPEYINREALKDYVSSLSTHALVDWSPWGVMSAIDHIPAADVVAVVRCRDCVYWRGENDICKGICLDFSADGYCSEGKRKDGGQDDV